ncbi:MAG: aldehyde dehydrogenase family protein [Clostridia bacterium]|nr:aldehyde dehydrogenase family protein [Clostridia bacterium]
MEAIIKGKRIQTEKAVCLNGVSESIAETLAAGIPDIRRVIKSLDELGKYLVNEENFLLPELMELGLTKEEALETKKGSLEILSAEELFKKIKRELGELPFEISRLSTRESAFEGWMPLGVLGHVTSSNDAMLPFFSSVEGILTGNINIIKTASGAHKVAMTMVEKLCEIDESLCPYFYVFPLSSKDEELLKSMFSLCNAIAVWGSDAATAGVRKIAPSGVKIIEWGNRISFAYFTKSGYTHEALKGLAEDVCVNDQQACSAPQMVFYETESKEELIEFAKAFMDVLQDVSDTYPLHPSSQAEKAELTTQIQLCHLDELMGEAKLFNGNGCRVFVQFDNELCASPLYRTVIVKAIKRSDVISALRPFRSYLQSVGLACGRAEISELSALLLAGGVNRITEPGLMMGGYTGEPHDGVPAMTQYLKRVSIINSKLPKGTMSLSEMTPMKKAPFEEGTPLMKKNDFPEKREIADKGYLLLKSGGSSGKAKYAPHTYDDAEVTYEEAARFIIAAGINPEKDVCMNLFYSGGLYGGFISIYEALKKADVVQLPMTAEMDMELVTKEIIANKVNVLMGMPTYLLKLFREQKDALISYGGIETVLYGGEHFDPSQTAYLKETFNIKRIGSLTYGCNEIGSMGYACEYCEGTIHHVVATKYLEILKLDKDEPVEDGEIGRLVWTPVDQENIEIKRYEIGDLGRFIKEPCKCGRVAPRFELLGRFGDTFKFATNYINYKKIKSVFGEKMGYTGWIQIVLNYNTTDCMTIYVENDFTYSEKDATDILSEEYPEISECLTDKTGTISVVKQEKDKFELSTGGGKVRSVIDKRILTKGEQNGN